MTTNALETIEFLSISFVFIYIIISNLICVLMADTSILPSNLQKQNTCLQIDYTDQAALCFKETLLFCLKNELATQADSIGNCSMSVENLGPQKCEFLINIKFCMCINNHFGGSKIICSATDEFDCLEEKRTEYIFHEGTLDKKTLYIGIQDGDYYVEAIQTCPYDKCKKCKNLMYHPDIKLLSEGTNLLLMRYLAIINYSGELTYKNIIIDGNIATCHYKCTAAKDMELNEIQMKVYMIEHEIENQNGNVETMRTYLTPEGKVLQHDWILTPYMLRSECLGNIQLKSDTFKKAIEYWIEDMEIFSKFLNEKCHEVAKFIEYLNDHCEVKQLIADYIQTLLIVKPLHVVDFTIQHFKAFSTCPEILEFILAKQTSQINTSMQQDKYGHANICSISHQCKHCRMFEQKKQIFQGSINSYCSTNSLCLHDVIYVEQAKTESNTTVFNLDISMEHKTEKKENVI